MGPSARWTNLELLIAAERVAGALAESGIEVTNRTLVTMNAPVRADLAAGVIAAAAVVAVAPLAADLPAERRGSLLERLQPARQIHAATVVRGDGTRAPLRARELDEVAFVLSTSGSSAEPKLVPSTHRNLWASSRSAAQGQLLGPGDRCLALGSMAHVLGLRTVTDALWAGASVITPDDLTVDHVSTLLAEHRPTCVIAPPPLLHTLLAAFDELGAPDRGEVAASLRYIRSGAAALRDGLVDRLRDAFGTEVLQGYGMTEVAKIACQPLGRAVPSGSVGRPLGVELRLDRDAFPEDGDPAGNVGEILVRGDVVAPGYFDDGHESASAFEGDWFRTGDLGRLDGDGNLFLVGRRDDVVSRGGVLLSLDHLEGALEAHHAVRAAIAIPIDHPNLGTDVVLGYVPEPGADIDSASLRSFLVDQLEGAQAPTRIVEIDHIPLASSGKPSRLAAADLVTRDAAIAPRADGGREVPTENLLGAMWCELLLLDQPIAPDDDFFALGADSLHLVELCTLLADRFGADVMPGELIGRSSLADMAALVSETMSRADRPLLVPLRDGAEGLLPLYLVPGAGGTTASFHRFVGTLRPGRRVLGFETPGLFDGEETPTSVSDLAKTFAGELLGDVGPDGYGLIGFCFGSVVAQEMARVLEAEGRPPTLLVMFDGPMPHAPRARFRRRLAKKLRRELRRLGIRRGPGRVGRPRVFEVQPLRRGHKVQPSSAPTLLFTSREHLEQVRDPVLGWQPFLAGGIDVVAFEGTHRGLLHEHAQETSAAVEDALRPFDAS